MESLNTEIINALVDDIKMRTENKIIEKTNAELLIKLIQNADTEEEAMAIASLGTMYKRTGFHYDVRLEKMGNTIKYLRKNDSLSFDQGGLKHKLIIGDNYDALRQLLITHKGLIDVIYIDPPYGCNDMGEFAKTNYMNQLTRDDLLSMLEPRFRLAKQLLTKDGVIFVSIDDKNQAYVKCLMDEIFGEQNFVANFVWRKQGGGKADSNYVAANCEYILAYVSPYRDAFTAIAKDDSHYNREDEHGRYHLEKLDRSSLSYSESLDYEIIINGESFVPGGNLDAYKKRKNGNYKIKDWRWRVSKAEFDRRYADGLLVVVENSKGERSIQEKWGF